jgi:Ca2+/Na+ antiporter
LQKTSEEQKSLVAQKKETKSTYKGWLNYVKAGFLIVLGTAITIVLAQPLMETLQDFSSAVNISSFMVSYVVIPIAMNYRQVLSTITSAREKTEKAISLTFSEVYFSLKLIFHFIVSILYFELFIYSLTHS